MIEKEFNADMLYSRIVHYYVDKKGYSKAKANLIAQRVVQRETRRRICRTDGCGHFSHDHLRNTGTCLVSDCMCSAFTGGTGQRAQYAHSADADAPTAAAAALASTTPAA